MKKKTDAQLFKELRINTLVIGSAMVLLYVISFFIESFGEYWYKIVLLFTGLLLISYSFQKYLQEHLKARKILMWVLSVLAILSFVVFFIIIKF